MEKHLELVETLNALETKMLLALSDGAVKADQELLKACEISEGQFRTAVELLKGKEALAVIAEWNDEFVTLTEVGQTAAVQGLVEMALLQEVQKSESMTIGELREKLTGRAPEEIGSAVGNLKELGLLVSGDSGKVTARIEQLPQTPLLLLQELVTKTAQAGTLLLAELTAAEQKLVKEGFKKRGKGKALFAIKTVKRARFQISTLGGAAAAVLHERGLTGKELNQLTPQMLADGSWRDARFRKYNISLKATRILVGKFNAYRQFLEHLQKQLLAMGFEEMRGPLLEAEFWNMDALFMPQFHSAREIHDAYFIKAPQYAESIPDEFIRQVAAVHENGGGTGSKGWGYSFDRQRTRRLILRSQGTALSARQLAQGPKVPGKYYAIARCFRYDRVDASHAPDFFQVEGIVVDEQANFKTLLGLLEIFAKEIAKAKDVKFVPAYFPFTEPSVEVHMKHPVLGWMELGGAGVFRPEVALPLGVRQPVMAWGLGIDRMAMMALAINDIRDLFTTDLEFVRATRMKGVL